MAALPQADWTEVEAATIAGAGAAFEFLARHHGPVPRCLLRTRRLSRAAERTIVAGQAARAMACRGSP
jgi:hypothetical protein